MNFTKLVAIILKRTSEEYIALFAREQIMHSIKFECHVRTKFEASQLKQNIIVQMQFYNIH